MSFVGLSSQPIFFDLYHYGEATPQKFREELERRFAIVENGEPNAYDYVEFMDWTKCRDTEFDINVARQQTWQRFCGRVEMYLKGKPDSTKLVWRVLPEDNLMQSYVVVSYDDNGPDIDYIADRRCHADKNWKRYAVYARFAVV